MKYYRPVHMNGRIYDPRLGRMLQADPFIQSPTNSQSLNRYSYVLNDTLSCSDSVGYSSFIHCIRKCDRMPNPSTCSWAYRTRRK